jgi:hypothetical protein
MSAASMQYGSDAGEGSADLVEATEQTVRRCEELEPGRDLAAARGLTAGPGAQRPAASATRA